MSNDLRSVFSALIGIGWRAAVVFCLNHVMQFLVFFFGLQWNASDVPGWLKIVLAPLDVMWGPFRWLGTPRDQPHLYPLNHPVVAPYVMSLAWGALWFTMSMLTRRIRQKS